MPSLFETSQANFQQAHGGGSRRGPGGHTQAPTNQAQALHSAGIESLHRSLIAQHERAQQSALQQRLLDNERVQKIALIQSVHSLADTLSPPVSSSLQTTTKHAAVKSAKKHAATEVPIFYGLKKIESGTCYDFRVRQNGQIMKVRNSLKADRFMIETASWVKDKLLVRQYKTVAILAVNEYGLVDFPAKSTVLCYDRYGGVQPSGWQDGVKKGKEFRENVGEGDHYLKPEAAAALFGILSDMNRIGVQVNLGDMSSSNGSDPGDDIDEKHHSGHGHMGSRSGLDVDFRYLNKFGESYRGIMSDKSFDKDYNQKLYASAYKYGFDRSKTYQGKTNLLKGVKTMFAHEDHGHLGFSTIPSNVIDYEPIHK